MKRFALLHVVLLLVLLSVSDTDGAVRVKDIVNVQGVHESQLIGYGLVVGLDGTGDGRNSLIANRSIRNLLLRFNIEMTQERLALRNVAAVMVTTVLPPFSRQGNTIDVTVSSLGDASSLEGGTLLLTPLSDKDGIVYGTAHGAVSIGGFNLETIGGERYRKNYALVGRVPQGCMLDRDAPAQLRADSTLTLLLKEPDFTSALRLSEAIDGYFGSALATPLDGGTVNVTIPQQFRGSMGVVRMIASIEALEITPDQVARVVINERTGTIVIGRDVKLDSALVTHGNLTIQVSAIPIISQPNAFSQGRTVVVPQTMTSVLEDDTGAMTVVNETATVSDLAAALNSLQVSPRDMIAIFQALKQAGALRAELVIM